MRYSAALLGLGLLALGTFAHGGPPPKPSVVPLKWELDFEYHPVQSITVRVPGEKKPRTFWYMLFSVCNRSGADRLYVPGFDLYTNTGQVLGAGKDVPTVVFHAIKKRHNNPLLMSLTAITGRILQGEDNAKDGVAIWRDFDPKARRFDVFISGLSGETVKIKLPVPVVVVKKDENGRPVKVTLNELNVTKTLQLSYSLPGEAASRTQTKPRLLAKRWVMR
ncbi:MAG: hypothetical protein B1H04_05140 [Planctomycetales bacterium 4484_123]|nr:MAG: hypothetical protein B1H04_05140 [Planctomycetales bacterium 4484_123]